MSPEAAALERALTAAARQLASAGGAGAPGTGAPRVGCVARPAAAEVAPADRAAIEARLGPGERARLGGIRHPGRRAEWWAARAAEREARAALGRGADAAAGGGTTVAHTRGLVVAVAWDGGGRFGVDVERAERMLSPRARARVLGWGESRRDGLGPLEAWLVREAAFKCEAPPAAAARVLSEYRLGGRDPADGIGAGEFPDGAGFRYLTVRSGGYLAALARADRGWEK